MTDAATRGRTAIATLSLLVLGGAAGVALDRLVLLHRPHVVTVQFSRLDDAAFAALDTVLALRPDQRDTVTAILNARQPEMDAVWQETHVRLLAIIDATIAELEAVLDAEQDTRLRALVAHLHGGASSLHR